MKIAIIFFLIGAIFGFCVANIKKLVSLIKTIINGIKK